MPRFVVLEHDHPVVHWDLMLESGGALRTWRLAGPPVPGAGPVAAEPSWDHRLVYLDYEGSVSGGRGRVTRWDGGTFEWEQATGEGVAIRLCGRRLHGRLVVERAGAGWQAVVLPDAPAGPA